MQKNHLDELNRRDFLRLSGLASAGVLATACAGGTSAPADTGGEDAGEVAAPATAEGIKDAAIPGGRGVV